MVEVTIQSVRQCCHNGQHVLFLKEKAGGRIVPLALDPVDAQIFTAEMAGAGTRQAHVYALLASTLDQLGARIMGAELHLGKNQIQGAYLTVIGQSGSSQIEAHPIDALAIAYRQGRPIFLQGEALDKISFAPRPRAEQQECQGGEEQGSANAASRPADDLPPAVRDFLSTLDLSALDDRTPRQGPSALGSQ